MTNSLLFLPPILPPPPLYNPPKPVAEEPPVRTYTCGEGHTVLAETAAESDFFCQHEQDGGLPCGLILVFDEPY